MNNGLYRYSLRLVRIIVNDECFLIKMLVKSYAEEMGSTITLSINSIDNHWFKAYVVLQFEIKHTLSSAVTLHYYSKQQC